MVNQNCAKVQNLQPVKRHSLSRMMIYSILSLILMILLTLARAQTIEDQSVRLGTRHLNSVLGEHRASREISSKNENYLDIIKLTPPVSSKESQADVLDPSGQNQERAEPVVTLATLPASQQQQKNNQVPDLDNQINPEYSNNLPQMIDNHPNKHNFAYSHINHPKITTNTTMQFGKPTRKNTNSHLHNQNLNKLQKHLNERQQELIRRNPGSLLAVAKAFKMTIVECQYQMRNEPWNCPIFGFSMKPTDIFGKMMSRSFKETSFIHSLLSSAITHSVARACTDSIITSCERKKTRDQGYSENIEFGIEFAREFMAALHELPSSHSQSNNPNNLNIDHNSLVNQPSSSTDFNGQQSNNLPTSAINMEPSKRERNIRNMINAHNDEVGRLHVLNGMRRECKCHGLSGACNLQSCWLELPPFREVASKLHDSLDQAIRVIYVAHSSGNRQKSLTSSTVKSKSNKKRSSIQPMNGLKRSPASFNSYSYDLSANSLTSDTASIIGSRRRGTKRHTNSDNCEDCHRASGSVNGGGGNLNRATNSNSQNLHELNVDNVLSQRNDHIQFMSTNSNLTTKRRPIARSIGITPSVISLDKYDLLYYEESPDFCVPDEIYNIKGPKGRICSDNINASNDCSKLCCGRGSIFVRRDEQYKCECQFKFCCQLHCKTCTRKREFNQCI